MRSNRFTGVLVLSVLIALILISITGAQTVQSLKSDVSYYISIGAIALLLVITVSAIAYAISITIKNNKAAEWTKNQIFEGILSLVLLIAFSSIIYVFLINPQSGYSALGLMPSQCKSSTNIFELGECDISTFNSYSSTLLALSFGGLFIEGLAPGIPINFPPILFSTGEISISISASTEINSIIPTSVFFPATVMVSALMLAMTLSYVQGIILSLSLFFLITFIPMGLVARIFGFSRSFAGTLISLGLGLGLVYPLIVSITYGFILVTISASFSSFLGNIGNLGISLIKIILDSLALGNPLNSITQLTAQAAIQGSIANAFKAISYIFLGLTLIPFLNFVVLETFITDFSSAIGEKVSFLVLLSGLV